MVKICIKALTALSVFVHCLKLLHLSRRLQLAWYITGREIYFWVWNCVGQLIGKIVPLFEKLTQKKLSQRWSYARRFRESSERIF